MFFTVVVIGYNVEDYISEAIESVLAQDYSDYEIIFVNDGSTDQTLERVVAFDNRRINPVTIPNGGISIARNSGVERANGEYIVFLDGDDLMAPGALRNFHAAASEDSAAIMLYGNSITFTDEDRQSLSDPNTGIEKRPSGHVLRNLLQRNIVPCPSCACIKNSVFRDLGGFDPGVRQSEDWEMWCRVSVVGTIKHVAKAVCFYRLRPGSIMDKVDTSLKSYETTFEKVYGNADIRSLFDESTLRKYRRNRIADLSYRLATSAIVRQLGYRTSLAFLQKAIATRPLHSLLFPARYAYWHLKNLPLVLGMKR